MDFVAAGVFSTLPAGWLLLLAGVVKLVVLLYAPRSEQPFPHVPLLRRLVVALPHLLQRPSRVVPQLGRRRLRALVWLLPWLLPARVPPLLRLFLAARPGHVAGPHVQCGDL